MKWTGNNYKWRRTPRFGGLFSQISSSGWLRSQPQLCELDFGYTRQDLERSDVADHHHLLAVQVHFERGNSCRHGVVNTTRLLIPYETPSVCCNQIGSGSRTCSMKRKNPISEVHLESRRILYLPSLRCASELFWHSHCSAWTPSAPLSG